MAVVWGSTVGSYGRIGIDVSTSSTATTTSVTVAVWFWSKYSVSDSSNTLYFDNLSSSGSASTSKGSVSVSTSVSSGSGWSTSNQKKLATYTYSYTRGTAASTRYLYAKLSGIDRVGGTMYASTTFSVPALASYTVTYNANGGSGAPSNQTKWYGKTLVLSSTKPTRSGYAFKGWATTSSGSVAYASGANYTANAAVTLYAVWQSTNYTVTYNANGGSGAPSSQTKVHGTALTLSTTKPTRTLYTFKGWGLTSGTSTVSYSPGGSYTKNASITLYAVWQYSYKIPRISNISIERCNSSGTLTDDGTYAKVVFNWACDYSATNVSISWKKSSDTSSAGSKTCSYSGISGSVSEIVGGGKLSTESSYDFTINVKDTYGEFEPTIFLSSLKLVIDIKGQGKGIAFGKTAETEGLADFGFDTIFRNNVQGNAYGLAELTAIPSNADLNNYVNTGCYGIKTNDIAETISNIPLAIAGRLIISMSLGQESSNAGYVYLEQKYIPYRTDYPIYVRNIERAGTSAAYTYSDWTIDFKDYSSPATGANFNNLTAPGIYPLTTVTDDTAGYSNCPLTSGTGTLEVIRSGVKGQIMQRVTRCAADTEIWERFYYSSAWQSWKRVYTPGTVLWSGGLYMSSGHTITLSEAVSSQPHGIVLCFSRYSSSTAQNYHWSTHYVPKAKVKSNPGAGQSFLLPDDGTFALFAAKYLYINDTTIAGNDVNTKTGTGSSGITYTNGGYVLRYVIGV